MISLVEQTIDFYLKNQKAPEIKDLKIKDTNLLNTKSSLFVTIYQKGEVRGSAWNIKELKENTVLELIENTIAAISKDSRFKPLWDNTWIKIRIDKIISRNILQDNKIKEVDPTNSGILSIKKDYSKMACILPNINPLLLTWEDFIPVLKEKLSEKKFEEKEYINYEIKTESINNF